MLFIFRVIAACVGGLSLGYGLGWFQRWLHDPEWRGPAGLGAQDLLDWPRKLGGVARCRTDSGSYRKETPSMDYDFHDDFAASPLGPFTEAHKQLVWGNRVTEDMDPQGLFFERIDDARLGGACCRMRYPANSVGMNHQFYQVRIKSPRTVANLSFDWLFEEGYDLTPPNPEKLGGLKIGPCINWGEVGGETSKRGTRAMIWGNGNGSHYGHMVYSPSCQDQRSGDQLIQPVVYSQPIELERVYHWEIQIFGGPEGHADWWLDGEHFASSIKGHALQVTPEDDVIFDFAFFSGGSQPCAPRWDSFARHGNIRCYSGERRAASAPPSGGDITLEAGTYTMTTAGRVTIAPSVKSR